jgi:hypothetical protein
MKASILDPTVLGSVSPQAAITYLRAHGWELGEGGGERVAKARRLFEGAEYFEVDIPLRSDFGDYPRRIRELIDTLELAESRSQIEILEDIRRSAFDVIRIAVDGGSVGQGRIGLESGANLYEHARDLMLAGACAALDKRPTYPTRKPALAMDYLRRVRLGPSATGSYIVSIESPVAPNLLQSTVGPQQALELDGDDASENDEAPFERRVTLTLARATSAVVIAAASASATGTTTPFLEAVPLGVNSNLCDALAGLIEDVGASSLAVRFAWSPSRAVPAMTPNHSRFEPDIVPILREASRIFREHAPQGDYELEGIPEMLSSQDAGGGGSILVHSIVDGIWRKVRLELNSDDYRSAIRAHEQHVRVYCEGELVKEGRNYSLKNPREFSIRTE